MVIIGLGTAGCNIASLFKQYGNYKVVLIDEGKGIPKCDTVEECEEITPNMKRGKLRGVKGDVIFILCGASKVASSALRIMEQIKDCNIKVVCVNPDPFFTPPEYMKRNRVVTCVLQQFARSGLLSEVILFDNKSITEIVGQGSIKDFYSKMNGTIASAVHAMNYFDNIKPIFGSRHTPREISRIKTIAIGSVEKNEEKLYFPLDNVTETCYIYSINEDELETDNDLISRIKQKISSDEQANIKSSFCIYSSDDQQSYYYSIKYTHYIQLEDK